MILEKRTEIINAIINKINAKKYLEIGTAGHCLNFEFIDCDYKIGLEPFFNIDVGYSSKNKDFIKVIKSDDFFISNGEKFDVIFIDGEHHFEQVYRDIINSLKFLEPGGYIVCHDMNPPEERHQIVPNPFIKNPPRLGESGDWNGDCWKAWVKIRTERNDLKMFVVDADQGCGIIHFGNQDKLKLLEEMNFNNFEKIGKNG
jgi:hypothetical protein